MLAYRPSLSDGGSSHKFRASSQSVGAPHPSRGNCLHHEPHSINRYKEPSWITNNSYASPAAAQA